VWFDVANRHFDPALADPDHGNFTADESAGRRYGAP